MRPLYSQASDSDAHLDTPASRPLSLSESDQHHAYDHSTYSSGTSTRLADDADHLGLPDCSQPSVQQTPWLTVPDEIAIELIYLYFDKIQPWLPLIHRPNFVAHYVGNSSTFLNPGGFCDEDMFLIYGILALAARHSLNAYFQAVSAPDRGNQFADKATEFYCKLRAAEEQPSLKCLQGCTLLAAYLYASGPCHRAWILTGVCVRMAYDLDLCDMDEGDGTWRDATEWTAIEERRRLFWVIWELDTFGSTLASRPSAINRQRIAVHLPVSDAAWFAQEPVASALVGIRPAEAWKCLLDSPNQDERAWFLLANYLMALTYEAASSGQACSSDQDELVGVLTCFNLAMSQRFSLETHAVLFDLDNFTKHNWIIGMHLMLTSARACLSALDKTQRTSSVIHVREFSRIISHWHPETVVLGHPFLACILLIPQISLQNEIPPPIDNLNPNTEMAMLMLAQYGSVWKLGSMLISECNPFRVSVMTMFIPALEVARLLKCRDAFSEEERALIKRFAVFFPCRTTGPSWQINLSAPSGDRHGGDGEWK
ncbi:hypothetical protein ACJZ2D_015080 [Fusarium nematophilum]